VGSPVVRSDRGASLLAAAAALLRRFRLAAALAAALLKIWLESVAKMLVQLPGGRPDRYDPGSFWSGDNLGLSAGFRLGGAIAVHLPAGTGMAHAPAAP
jgi:hypothetical protein